MIKKWKTPWQGKFCFIDFIFLVIGFWELIPNLTWVFASRLSVNGHLQVSGLILINFQGLKLKWKLLRTLIQISTFQNNFRGDFQIKMKLQVLSLSNQLQISYHKVLKISEMLGGEILKSIRIITRITKKAYIIKRNSVLEKRLNNSLSKHLRRDHLV